MKNSNIVIIFLLLSISQISSKQIQIGPQDWMIKNLDVIKFRNGDSIFFAKNEKDWYDAIQKKIPACCYYDYNDSNKYRYGMIYNWYAVQDYRGLAPVGWRIPNDRDFINLTAFLGSNAGIDLKSVQWLREIGINPNALQKKPGFNAEPGGFKIPSKGFGYMGYNASFWTNSLYDGEHAKTFSNSKDNNGFVNCCDKLGLSGGASVRCIKE